MRVFLEKLNHHRAKKDISEVLEQFHSSKNLSEAHRAILTNHNYGSLKYSCPARMIVTK